MSLDSLISEKKEEIKKLRRDKKLAYLKKYYQEVLKPQRAKKRRKDWIDWEDTIYLPESR